MHQNTNIVAVAHKTRNSHLISIVPTRFMRYNDDMLIVTDIVRSSNAIQVRTVSVLEFAIVVEIY